MSQLTSVQVTNAERAENRSASVRRWGALIGGTTLAILGLSRRSRTGLALAASGGALAYLGTNRFAPRSLPVARSSVLVNCTPEEAFRFWRDFENLPRFMNHLESVTVLDSRRSWWTAIFGMGHKLSWEAEITDERENEYIGWRSLPGSDLEVTGRVDFQRAPVNRGTIITAVMEYRPRAGVLDNVIARFLGKVPNFLMRQDLRRLEAILEAGEIPTTEGQSHGRRDAMTAAMRTIDPTRPISRESRLDEVIAGRKRVS